MSLSLPGPSAHLNSQPGHPPASSRFATTARPGAGSYSARNTRLSTIALPPAGTGSGCPPRPAALTAAVLHQDCTKLSASDPPTRGLGTLVGFKACWESEPRVKSGRGCARLRDPSCPPEGRLTAREGAAGRAGPALWFHPGLGVSCLTSQQFPELSVC